MHDYSRINKVLVANRSVGIEIQAAKRVAPQTYKVIASTSTTTNAETFAAEISKQMDTKVALIPGTFANNGRRAMGFFRAIAQSRPFDGSYKEIGSAQAADADGKLWSVVTVNGQKRVVAESSDDLEDLFNTRIRARKTVLGSTDLKPMMVGASISGNGDMIKFLDPAQARVRLGIALNIGGSLSVVAKDGNPIRITEDVVMASIPRSELPPKFQKALKPYQARAALSPEDASTILAYLREAYGVPESDEMMRKYAAQMGVALPEARTGW